MADFTVAAGQRVAVRPDLAPLARAEPAAAWTPARPSRTPRPGGAHWSERCTYTGRLARGSPALAHHAEGADLRADRRHRGRGDDLAARAARRGAQLGLPLLLAARRHLHPATRCLNAGYREEARAWRRVAAAARWPASPPRCNIMYGLAGERRLTELELTGCPATRAPRPVRIGNAAYRQLQLDVYGEVLDALYQARRVGLAAGGRAAGGCSGAWSRFVETAWEQPGRGHLGGARPAAALHPLQGHGLGRLGPGGQGGRALRAGRAGRALAPAARRRSTRRSAAQGFDAAAERLRPVVRLDRSWTPAC